MLARACACVCVLLFFHRSHISLEIPDQSVMIQCVVSSPPPNNYQLHKNSTMNSSSFLIHTYIVECYWNGNWKWKSAPNSNCKYLSLDFIYIFDMNQLFLSISQLKFFHSFDLIFVGIWTDSKCLLVLLNFKKKKKNTFFFSCFTFA